MRAPSLETDYFLRDAGSFVETLPLCSNVDHTHDGDSLGVVFVFTLAVLRLSADPAGAFHTPRFFAFALDSFQSASNVTRPL
jgi:hypothetical protein